MSGACAEGFHWIGQSFASCENCGKPAWEHAGMHALGDPAANPFAEGGWRLEPWQPGEAERIKAKWDPDKPVWKCRECRAMWPRTPDAEDQPPWVREHQVFERHNVRATTRGLG